MRVRLGGRRPKSWPRVLSPTGRGESGAMEEAHMGPFKDIGVDLADMVATIEIRRPPHNFFDIELIRQIADACEALDKDDGLPRHRAGGAGHGLLRRRQARRRRRRAERAGQEIRDRTGGPPLHRGRAPVPHGQADRRRHPRRGGRRRARPGAGAGPARHLPGGALLAPTSPGSASIRASGSPTRCRR